MLESVKEWSEVCYGSLFALDHEWGKLPRRADRAALAAGGF